MGARRSALALRWEAQMPMEPPPRPEVQPDKYGMDTIGVHIKASLLWLLQKKKSSASKEVLEDLVAEVRHAAVLKKLPSACEADKLLDRYMLLQMVGTLHFATAQNNMVWEPLYDLLVQPVEEAAGAELAKIRV